MAWYWWLLGVFAGLCLYVCIGVRRDTVREKRLNAEISAFVGRTPDYFYILREGKTAPKMLAFFLLERRVYLGDLFAPFEAKNFLTDQDIRTWSVEWDTGVDGQGRTYRTRYAVKLTVKSIDRPLIKITCQDEGTAYKIREILAQTFGEREGAASAP